MLEIFKFSLKLHVVEENLELIEIMDKDFLSIGIADNENPDQTASTLRAV